MAQKKDAACETNFGLGCGIARSGLSYGRTPPLSPSKQNYHGIACSLDIRYISRERCQGL